MTAPIRRPPSDLPHLAIEERGALAIVRLDRAAKRNAVNDALIQSLERFFETPPGEAKAVVLAGAGEHFCAGLDLSEHEHRDAFGVMRHSQMWHRVFEKIQFGTLPVVTAMQGGVIGGGLELAAATHVRVADTTAFYALPEGQRGIFVGGGATVRVGRIVGAGRLVEMMLTGRSYDAAEGQRLGLSHYLVEPGAGVREGGRARRAHRRQRHALELRHPQRHPAHRGHGDEGRAVHGIADGSPGADRRRGRGEIARLLGAPERAGTGFTSPGGRGRTRQSRAGEGLRSAG